MDPFYVLEIEATKDKEAIKQAYRSKLTQVNPEDDPEGFKALRTAYEEALRLCDLPDEEKKNPFDDSPLGLWMQKISAVYQSITKRQDVQEWKELLEDEICLALDTSIEAREQLLAFLMEHYRCPQKIYQCIEENFHIIDDYNELVEQFPENFLRYFEYQVNTEDFIDYSLFEGEETADYDAYILEYLALKEKVDTKDFEKIEKDFEAMERFQISHPFLYVERLRIAMEQGNFLEEGKKFKELTHPYRHNIYIRYYEMLVDWGEKNYEKAHETILYLLEKYPNHFSAQKKLAEYYYIKEEYEKSKDLCMDLLELNLSDTDVLRLMQKNNAVLLERLKEQLKQNPENQETFIEIGWCLYQNEQYEACHTHLKGHTPSGTYILDYHNLYGRNLVAIEKYEEALPSLTIWEEEIAKLADDESEEAKRKKRRHGLVRYLHALCYSELSKKAEYGDAYKQKAIDALQVNIDSWSEPEIQFSAYHLKADMLLALGKNEQCIDICEQVLKKDSGYFPAYVLLQEAYFNLKDAQQVIDIFYKAIDIYAYYVKPYIFAAKVFYFYKQYDDAKKIFAMAKENNLTSNELELYEIKNIRFNTNSKEDILTCITRCEALEKKLDSNENDISDISLVYLEKIWAYMDLLDYKKAYQEVNRLTSKCPKDNVLQVKADILMKLDRCKEAKSIYEKNAKNNPHNAMYLYDLAACYTQMDLDVLALQTYQKVLELEPDHPNANSRVSNLYQKQYEAKWNRKTFESALEYATKQLNNQKNSYYLIERGLIYIDGGMLQDAIADFLAAIEDNPSDIYAYNNLAYAYELSGKNDEAIEMYQKAIEVDKTHETSLPYVNLGDVYMIKHEYDTALGAYERTKAIFPQYSLIKKMGDAYRRNAKYDQAIALYKQGLSENAGSPTELLLSIADTYAEQKDYKQAEKYYKSAMKSDPQGANTYYDVAEYYFYITQNYRKALSYYKKAFKCTSLYHNKEDLDLYCTKLVEIYSVLGNNTKTKKYFEIALHYYEKTYGTIEDFLDEPHHRLIHVYRVFRLYLFSGDLHTAKKYKEQMFCHNRCAKCYFNKCCEAHMAQGLYAEISGDIELAIKSYETVLSEDINEPMAQAKLRKLNNKNN